MRSLSIESAIEMIRRTLIDTPAVSALVGDQVLGAYPEQVDAGQATYPMVALVATGGSMRRFGASAVYSVDLLAYSSISGSEAGAIYDACATALQIERITFPDTTANGGERAAVCEEAARPRAMWDEGLRKHVQAGRWSCRVLG